MPFDTLRFITPMMHGPAVKRLQEMLEQLGFDVPDADGIFGVRTKTAIEVLQQQENLTVNGEANPVTMKTLEMKVAQLSDADVFDGNNTQYASTNASEGCIDIRKQHTPPKNFARKRSWSDITGVTLHQTGCTMSDNPKRWYKLNAHIGVTRDGKALIVNDPTDMIWHAQGLSHGTIGIEICGNFAGVDGNTSTLWKGGGGPDHLTREMEDALERLFQWLQNAFISNGQQWQHVYAHRQSSKTRTSDPGSEIWQKIALPWMKRLGATDGGDGWKLKNGKPIPREWNPAYATRYAG